MVESPVLSRLRAIKLPGLLDGGKHVFYRAIARDVIVGNPQVVFRANHDPVMEIISLDRGALLGRALEFVISVALAKGPPTVENAECAAAALLIRAGARAGAINRRRGNGGHPEHVSAAAGCALKLLQAVLQIGDASEIIPAQPVAETHR